jgi:hypothetical protein
LFGFKEWVFALFLLAGIFKPNPAYGRSPIDLTVLTGVVTSACVVWIFLKLPRRPLGSTLLVLTFFLLFIPTLFWTDWTPYAIDKALRFYTLTLLATVAPLYLIRTVEELRRFVSGFLFLCAIVAATAQVVMLSQGGALERLMVLDATTIATGRSIGVLGVAVAFLWFEDRTNRLALSIALIILPTLLIATGAKGPLLSAPLALLFTLLLLRTKVRVHLPRMILVCLLACCVILLSLPIIPWASLIRVGGFVNGQWNNSEFDRTSFIAESLQGIERTPQGLGLGGFASKYGVGAGEIGEYPHNIALEAFLEGGWMVGCYFIFLLLSGLAGVYSVAKKNSGQLVFKLVICLMVFYLLNDLVSGELNESKVLMAFIGLAVGIKAFFPYRVNAPRRNTCRALGPATP